MDSLSASSVCTKRSCNRCPVDGLILFKISVADALWLPLMKILVPQRIVLPNSCPFISFDTSKCSRR
jgi:hypothetical protein